MSMGSEAAELPAVCPGANEGASLSPSLPCLQQRQSQNLHSSALSSPKCSEGLSPAQCGCSLDRLPVRCGLWSPRETCQAQEQTGPWREGHGWGPVLRPPCYKELFEAGHVDRQDQTGLVRL